MSNLALTLKRGDRLLLNGVLMEVGVDAGNGRFVLCLQSRARFVFGKQYMPEADATTPAKRLYYAVQQAYAGGETLNHVAMLDALRAFTSEADCGPLRRREVADAVASLGTYARLLDGYKALKQAREIVKIEAALAHG